MTRKEIKKERNATIALMLSTIVAILINVLAVFLNLRGFILGLLAVPQIFEPLTLVFTVVCTACAILLATYIPNNLKTIRDCNEYLDRHPEDPDL